MIGRRPPKPAEPEIVEPKGFDDYKVRLGDVMRGERATMGKSLLDVQRELRIKAAYIAAIENCDPGAFDTPGFIAGYVRSYARYLNMDPDGAFETFCAESGFQVAHGMQAEASSKRKPGRDARLQPLPERDVFAGAKTPFAPMGESLFANVEPRAIGSMLVLLGLIGTIGYGGWAVLREVQQVQVAPVEQTPVVLSDLDPLAGAQGTVDRTDIASGAPALDQAPDIEVTRSAALDRLYRPQALDVPVLVARDAPIATLDPRDAGAFAGFTSNEDLLPDLGGAINGAIAEAVGQDRPAVPQVVEDIGPSIRMVAAYASWVRVRSAEGNTLFEGIMQPGDTWDIPATEGAPSLRTGESGAIYFAMGTECYGPVGSRGQVTKNFPIERTVLAESLEVVVPDDSGSALNRMFADLRQVDPSALPAIPCQSN